MATKNVFTRRVMGMDYRVWLVMLSICILSLGLFGYRRIRYDSDNSTPCRPGVIVVNGKSVKVLTTCDLDEFSHFQLQSDSAGTIEWNFRDGTDIEVGPVVSHKYGEPGTYWLTATVNKRCNFDIEVQVFENLLSLQTPEVEIYPDPSQLVAGHPFKLHCATEISDINSYQWKVMETNNVQTAKEPLFVIKDPGRYTVQLILNNDTANPTLRILQVVAEASQVPQAPVAGGAAGEMPGAPGPLGPLVPPPGTSGGDKVNSSATGAAIPNPEALKPPTTDSSKESPAAKAPAIDQKAFQELLQNVVDKKKEIDELVKYLDYGSSTMVLVNNKNPVQTLKEFCEATRVKRPKLRKIEDVKFKFDDHNSIQSIKVQVPEAGFWDKVTFWN